MCVRVYAGPAAACIYPSGSLRVLPSCVQREGVGTICVRNMHLTVAIAHSISHY